MRHPDAHRLNVLTMVDGIGTYGGAESMARSVAMRLDPDRFESTFCVTRWEPRPEYDEALAELDRAGVGFIGLERHGHSLRPWRELMRRMREQRIDVLHTHKVGSNFWGSILAPRASVRAFIAQEHGVAAHRSLPRRLADRYLVARRASAFVAVCEADRRRMIEAERIPEAKTRVIRNGIVGRSPARPPESMRRELAVVDNALVVGIVATLRPEKAVDVLLQAAGRVLPRFPDLRVVVVGGPDSLQPEVATDLERLRDRLGLRDAVTFTGLRLDIPEIVGMFDVAVLCSDREASPLAIMEYMEAGKPVVGTRVGGIPELIRDGETGILVEPQDPGVLAHAIGRLLDDPRLRARMGDAARRLRREEYKLSRTVERFELLYEELAANTPHDHS